jgi:hypothetical protein
VLKLIDLTHHQHEMTSDLVEDFKHAVTNDFLPSVEEWPGAVELNEFYRFVKLESAFLAKRPHLAFQVRSSAF